jgi:hypothetical protein
MEVAEEFEGDIEVVENEADGDGPLPPHRKRHQRHLLACVQSRADAVHERERETSS